MNEKCQSGRRDRLYVPTNFQTHKRTLPFEAFHFVVQKGHFLSHERPLRWKNAICHRPFAIVATDCSSGFICFLFFLFFLLYYFTLNILLFTFYFKIRMIFLMNSTECRLPHSWIPLKISEISEESLELMNPTFSVQIKKNVKIEFSFFK